MKCAIKINLPCFALPCLAEHKEDHSLTQKWQVSEVITRYCYPLALFIIYGQTEILITMFIHIFHCGQFISSGQVCLNIFY